MGKYILGRSRPGRPGLSDVALPPASLERVMGCVLRFPYVDVLGPEDIRVAASAFESTLKSLDGNAEEDATREAVARYIMERTLQGERDPIRLRDGALAQFRKPAPKKNV